jgi:hypothetical protein
MAKTRRPDTLWRLMPSIPALALLGPLPQRVKVLANDPDPLRTELDPDYLCTWAGHGGAVDEHGYCPVCQ